MNVTSSSLYIYLQGFISASDQLNKLIIFPLFLCGKIMSSKNDKEEI